jgi:hypothetical protein
VINDGDVVILGSSQTMMCAYHIAIISQVYSLGIITKMKGSGHLQQGP